MDLEELKEGNLIKVYPRENQEGLLSICEIQRSSAICEMITPRRGYQFRLKPSEINPVLLTDDWLVSAGFSKNDSSWTDLKGVVRLKQLPNGRYTDTPTGISVNYVHELQNEYLRVAGKTLIIDLTPGRSL